MAHQHAIPNDMYPLCYNDVSVESEDEEDYCPEEPCSSYSESYDSHAEESIFSVTLADSPQNAATVLLQLHKTNNIMRDWFAEELHDIMLSSSDPRWTAFLQSGLQDVLMDIACDPNMLKFDEVPDYALHVSYFTHILHALSCMLVHIADHKDIFSEDEFTRYLMHIWHNLATFYDGIWERRARLLEYVDEDTEDFKEALLNFIACARFLPDQKKLDCPGARVLFYGWFTADRPDFIFDTLSTVYNYIGENMDDQPALRGLFTEVISDDEHTYKAAFQCHQWLHSELYDGMKDILLKFHMFVFAHVALFCTKIFDVDLNERLTFMQCIAAAWERQHCMGTDVDETEQIVWWATTAIRVLLSPNNTGNTNPSNSTESPETINRVLGQVDLIPLLAKNAVICVGSENCRFFDDTDTVLASCISVASHLMKSRKKSRLLRKMKESANKYIKPTIESFHDVTPNSPQAELEKGSIIFSWIRLGAILEVEVIPIAVPVTIFKSCHWNNCLCRGRKPYHSLRVCNGCMKVFYCGAQCQKRDWNEGKHAEQCHRWRQQSQRQDQ